MQPFVVPPPFTRVATSLCRLTKKMSLGAITGAVRSELLGLGRFVQWLRGVWRDPWQRRSQQLRRSLGADLVSYAVPSGRCVLCSYDT